MSVRLRIAFDTSGLLDLFGKWSKDYKQRRGDLVREVQILAPLRSYLVSSRAILQEVHRQLAIGTDLERYVAFEDVSDEDLAACPGYVANRGADYSLVALARRIAGQGFQTFLITKDRTFVGDLARAGSNASVVPPTGFAEAVTVLTREGTTSRALADRLQNNTFENLSNSMRLIRATQGDAAYFDWQEFLNSRTAAKHELVEALRATGIVL